MLLYVEIQEGSGDGEGVGEKALDNAVGRQ